MGRLELGSHVEFSIPLNNTDLKLRFFVCPFHSFAVSFRISDLINAPILLNLLSLPNGTLGHLWV